MHSQWKILHLTSEHLSFKIITAFLKLFCLNILHGYHHTISCRLSQTFLKVLHCIDIMCCLMPMCVAPTEKTCYPLSHQNDVSGPLGGSRLTNSQEKAPQQLHTELVTEGYAGNPSLLSSFLPSVNPTAILPFLILLPAIKPSEAGRG